MDDVLTLPGDSVHVWWTRSDEVSPALLASYESLLSTEERARRDRYRFEHSRTEYLITRALVRTLLSRYAPVAPEAWTFRANAHGCPAIDEPRSARWLRFNLSNTRGLVACVVASERDVGIDVEDAARDGETVAIADRFFAPSEVAALRALPADRQRERFFRIWTLKEAYIKARGMGLAIPLDQFAFELDRGGEVAVVIDAQLQDRGETWQFTEHAPLASHRMAVAVRRAVGESVQLALRETVPRPR